MDPGQSHLDHLKLVPNLIEEDPAAITPSQQKAYMDMPWKDFSAMLHKNKEEAELAAQNRHNQQLLNEEQSRSTTASSSPAVQTPKDATPTTHAAVSTQLDESDVGGWDSETGYQDMQHASMRH